MIFYFSGTGNSKWIANQLSKEQQEDLFFIPDAWKNDTWEFSLREDEKIGFVFPVYSWAASRDCTGVYSEAGSEGVSAAISVLCVFVWRRYGADPAGDGKGIGCEGMEM